MKNVVRSTRLVFLFLGISLLSGCSDYVSLFPLYDDLTLTTDPPLDGDWQSSEGDTWTFVRRGQKYSLTVTDDEGERWKFEAGLVQLSGRLFLDLCSADTGITGAPAHMFARIRLDKTMPDANRIEVGWLVKSWMDEHLSEKQMTYLPETQGKTILTAPTATLQDFFRRHAWDDEAFSPQK